MFCQPLTACDGCVIAIDIWNEGQLDEDNDEVERLSISSHSEVAQLEDITGQLSARVAEGADDVSPCCFIDVLVLSSKLCAVLVDLFSWV